ncbi:Uncharacterised protein [Vibrio cholerae]|uniref:Uncharacterized protein n=1 Tax=Vibrio cholerae TaxID=666 RepID=A0A656ASU0_VIBCL|nr:Uncharacterised protein [Vibrio cholerae]CRZ62405.1 Uncharacterised protein [Vibrio cholerae]CRZ70478.1 Uncharacterised protein [Vibrio cholerae]CRZ75754.1 Uncharacterised protein [Vibrio cholerae]CRZ82204.1 Uncharacterised protein [Vibrio cholerae]
MPRAQMKRHKLHHLTISADHAVRRHAHLGDYLKKRMLIGIQLAQKKLLNVRAAKLAGGQADVVHHK